MAESSGIMGEDGKEMLTCSRIHLAFATDEDIWDAVDDGIVVIDVFAVRVINVGKHNILNLLFMV